MFSFIKYYLTLVNEAKLVPIQLMTIDTVASLVYWSKKLPMYLVAYRVDRNAAVYLKERESMDQKRE